MDRSHLLSELDKYGSSYPEELLFVARFKSLLKHPECFFRDHLPGHITGSAWITNSSFTKILLIRHAKLKRWLQPGGHADGDENVLRVAEKELMEETGLEDVTIVNHSIFDLDIHSIPATEKFPKHFHYDVRYLFAVNDSAPLVNNHESHDIKWVHLFELKNFTNEHSILRMKEKLEAKKAIWN